jgi:hypothetical protein
VSRLKNVDGRDESIFRKSGRRFSEENATKSIKPERFPIQRNREALEPGHDEKRELVGDNGRWL